MASGLVFLTGPLCFTSLAQDYVDVEAERNGRIADTPMTMERSQPSSGIAPVADPYGAKPAQSYPATSYGLNNAAGPAIGAPVAPPRGGQSQNVGNLYIQFQQLQQEVMRLNGLVEEQGNELRKLKAQSLERYVDLDKRVSAAGTGNSATPATVVANPVGSSSNASTNINTNSKAAQAGEEDAYRAAYALVRGQRFDEAVSAFRTFLGRYPDGQYGENAHYWLGELYLVVDPVDLEAARQSFSLLLSQYPNTPKAADALYKLGKVHFMKGNRDKARSYFDRVIREYGNSNSSAVKLSRDFIAESY